MPALTLADCWLCTSGIQHPPVCFLVNHRSLLDNPRAVPPFTGYSLTCQATHTHTHTPHETHTDRHPHTPPQTHTQTDTHTHTHTHTHTQTHRDTHTHTH